MFTILIFHSSVFKFWYLKEKKKKKKKEISLIVDIPGESTRNNFWEKWLSSYSLIWNLFLNLLDSYVHVFVCFLICHYPWNILQNQFENLKWYLSLTIFRSNSFFLCLKFSIFNKMTRVSLMQLIITFIKNYVEWRQMYSPLPEYFSLFWNLVCILFISSERFGTF